MRMLRATATAAENATHADKKAAPDISTIDIVS